jgi:hypothetical protein
LQETKNKKMRIERRLPCGALCTGEQFCVFPVVIFKQACCSNCHAGRAWVIFCMDNRPAAIIFQAKSENVFFSFGEICGHVFLKVMALGWRLGGGVSAVNRYLIQSAICWAIPAKTESSSLV